MRNNSELLIQSAGHRRECLWDTPHCAIHARTAQIAPLHNRTFVI